MTLKEKGEADLAPRFGNLKRLDEDRFTTRFDRFDDLIRATDFLDSINNDRSARGCEDFDYIYNERKVIEHNGESFLLLYRTIYRNSAYFAATPLNPQSEYGLGTFLFFYADLFSKNGYTLETDKERLKLLFRELRRYTNMIKEDDDDDDESW